MTCTQCGEHFESAESIGCGCRLCQMCWEEESARAWWEMFLPADSAAEEVNGTN